MNLVQLKESLRWLLTITRASPALRIGIRNLQELIWQLEEKEKT
jgi:hypothetical protein